jgi:deoxyribonuclease-4
MAKAVDRAQRIGATAIQVFGDNPTAWRRRVEPPPESAVFRERLGRAGIGPVSIHAAYLVNLAGPDPAFFERSVEVLAADMLGAWAFSASFVNVHVGSRRDASVEAGINRVAEGVAEVLGRVPEDTGIPQLVLENGAGGGGSIGATIEELAEVAEAVARLGVAARRVGFCLDTAHLWGAGYAISDPDVIDGLIDQFQSTIGLDRLSMIHLNDSKSPLGSRTDRHEHLGVGQIGPLGLAHLLRHPRLADVPFYLETPGMDLGYDEINLQRARDLAAGRPLQPLPPEAFDIRRSRSRGAHPSATGGAHPPVSGDANPPVTADEPGAE